MVITETASSKCGSATNTDDLLQAYEQISKAARNAKALKDKVHIEQQQKQLKRTSQRNTTKTTLMMEETPDDRRDDSIGHNGTNTTSTSTASTSSRRRRGVCFNDVVQVTNIPTELLDHQPSDENEDDDGRYGDDERDDNSCSIGESSTYDSCSDFSNNNHEEELFDILSSNSTSLMDDIVEGEMLEKGGYWKGLGDLIGGVSSDDDDVEDVESLNGSMSETSSTSSCSDNDSCSTTDPTPGNNNTASATTATTPSSSVLVKNPNITTDLAIINTTKTSCLNMLFDEIVGDADDISQCSFCSSSCGTSSSTNNNGESDKFEATALKLVAPANRSNNKAPDTAEVTVTSSSKIGDAIPKLLEEFTDILPTCIRDPCLFDKETKDQNQSKNSKTEGGGKSISASAVVEAAEPTQSTLDLALSIEDDGNDDDSNTKKKVQIPNKEEKPSQTSDNDQTKNGDNTTKPLPIEVTEDESDDTTLFFLEDPKDAIEDELQRGLSNVFANLNVSESSGSTGRNIKNDNQELKEAEAVGVSSSTQREHHLQQIYDVSSSCVTVPSQGDDGSHFIEDQAIVVTHGGFGSDPEDTTTRFFRLYDGASDDGDNCFSTHPSDCDVPIINKRRQEEGRDVDDENQIRNIVDWHQSPTSCVTRSRSISSTMMAGEWIVNESTSNNSAATKNDDAMPSQGIPSNHTPNSQKHNDNNASGTQESPPPSSKTEKQNKKETQSFNTNIYESNDSHDIWKDIIAEKEESSNNDYHDDNYDEIESNNTSSTAATVKTRGASVLTAPPRMFSEGIFDGLEEEDDISLKKSTSKENTKSIDKKSRDDDKNESSRSIASSTSPPSALEPHLKGLPDESNSLLKDPENTINDHEVSIPIAKESSKINLRIKTDVSHDETTKSETPRESALKKLSMNCEDCETPTISSPIAREAALKKLDYIARGRKKGQDNQECHHRQQQSCDKESETATTSQTSTTNQKVISDCEDQRESSTASVKSLDALKVDREKKCPDDEHGHRFNSLSPSSTTSPNKPINKRTPTSTTSPNKPINKRTPTVAKRRKIFPNVKYLDEDAQRFSKDDSSTNVSPTSTNQEGLSPVSDVQLSTPCYKFTGISPTFTATKQRKANDDKDESSSKLLTERIQGKPLYAPKTQSPSSSEEHTGKPKKFEEENANLASKTSASNQASLVNDTDIHASVSKNKQPGDGDRQTETSVSVPPKCSSIEITDISEYVEKNGLRAHVATNTRSYEEIIISPCSNRSNEIETTFPSPPSVSKNKQPGDGDRQTETSVSVPTSPKCSSIEITDISEYVGKNGLQAHVATNTRSYEEIIISPCSNRSNEIETTFPSPTATNQENTKRELDVSDLLDENEQPEDEDCNSEAAVISPTTIGQVGPMHPTDLQVEATASCIEISVTEYKQPENIRLNNDNLDNGPVDTERRRQDVVGNVAMNDLELMSPSLARAASTDGVRTASSGRSTYSDDSFVSSLVLDRKTAGTASSGPSTYSDDSFLSSLVFDRETVGTKDIGTATMDDGEPSHLANMDGVGTAPSVRSAPSDEYFEEKLSSLELEIKALKDQLLRSLEEQESMRQIAKRGDATLAKKDAIKSFAISLSEISNNLQRALDVVPEEVLYSSVDDGSTKAFQTRSIQASCCLQEIRDVFHRKHSDADTRFDDDTTIDTDTGECKTETTSTGMGPVSNKQDEANPTVKKQNPSSKDCGVFHFAVDATDMEPTSRKTEIKPELTQSTQMAGELSKQQEISAIQTNAGELANVFYQALIVVNNEIREIHVGKFLFACEKLSQAIRNVGIIPSADDIMSNVKKVRTAYDCFPHEDRRNSMMAIIQHELDTGVHSNPQKIFTENSAAMGFLWIARNINYQHFLFSHVLNNKDEEPYDAALYAYERAMKPYLPWMLQQVGLAVLVILKPMSKSLIYSRIGGFEDDRFGSTEERATIRDIQLVLETWKPIIAQCRKVFFDLNLGHKI